MLRQWVRVTVYLMLPCVARNPDLLSAILNSWSSLVKLRPGFVQIVVSSLTLWTPAPLVGLPFTSIRSVEKSVRILLTHISRYAHSLKTSTFTRLSSDPLVRKLAQILRVISTTLSQSSPNAWNKLQQTKERVGL